MRPLPADYDKGVVRGFALIVLTLVAALYGAVSFISDMIGWIA